MSASLTDNAKQQDAIHSQRTKDKNLDYLLDDLPPTLEQHDRELDETYIRRLRREIKRLRRVQSYGPADDARDAARYRFLRNQKQIGTGNGLFLAMRANKVFIQMTSDFADDRVDEEMQRQSATDSEANK